MRNWILPAVCLAAGVAGAAAPDEAVRHPAIDELAWSFDRNAAREGDVGIVDTHGAREGGAIHGTSIALKEEARFDAERILSDSWETYPVLRFSEVPRVTVKLIARPEELLALVE